MTPLKNERVEHQPYTHLVAEFADHVLLSRTTAEFPPPSWDGWFSHVHTQSLKKASRGRLPGPFTEELVATLSERSFLDHLGSSLGIERPLLVDPTREGGGLHLIERGGFLGMHADFNVHPKFGWDRRVNLLLYLNVGWQSDEGGHLVLSGSGLTRSYAPEWGRVVAFPTRDDTLHGHPVPVTRSRRSIALYFYTEGRPDHERSAPHTTFYTEVPGVYS